jgi:hypothetical protein
MEYFKEWLGLFSSIPRILICCWLSFGCTPSLYWIPESSSIPSCQPDRLLQWSDFVPRVPKDERAAETAVRFLLHPSLTKLQITFDHEHSWVNRELLEPENPHLIEMSKQLLAHEQVHFLISCLVVRQTNLSLLEQDDIRERLELTKLTAQRLNLQYDATTNHGQNLDAQRLWEADVMRQLQILAVQSTQAF